MLILSPRQIGCNVNIDNIQFFIDYCNSAIQAGNFYSTGFLPTFKVIAVTMDVELVDPTDKTGTVLKHIVLTDDERVIVESLFAKQGWFTKFTSRKEIEEFLPLANVESISILTRMLTTLPETYDGTIFTLGTFAFGTPEESKVPKLVEEKVDMPNEQASDASTEIVANTDAIE